MRLNLNPQSVKNKGKQGSFFYSKIKKKYINWVPNLYKSSKQFS